MMAKLHPERSTSAVKKSEVGTPFYGLVIFEKRLDYSSNCGRCRHESSQQILNRVRLGAAIAVSVYKNIVSKEKKSLEYLICELEGKCREVVSRKCNSGSTAKCRIKEALCIGPGVVLSGKRPSVHV